LFKQNDEHDSYPIYRRASTSSQGASESLAFKQVILVLNLPTGNHEKIIFVKFAKFWGFKFDIIILIVIVLNKEWFLL
jgi:hypothetical protein